MNKEIKLMLNIIKDVSEHKEGSRNGLMILGCKDYKTLYDYIINLQQENEKLKYQLKIQEDLTIKNRLRRHVYKSRCEKAIEYMKENYNELTDYGYKKEIYDDLLNILQNGSEENE